MRADKAPIIRMDLDKSNNDLVKIAKTLGISITNLNNDKKRFKTLFFMVDNDLQYQLFAYIRKNSTKVEYTQSIGKYLSSLSDTSVEEVQEIKETFDRINNNWLLLLGEKVDNNKEKHLDKLSYIIEGEGDSKKKPVSKKTDKVTSTKKLDIDKILDKIDQKGINSLTKVERKFLEDYSKNL